MNQSINNNPKKNLLWLWILIIVVVLIICGYFIFRFYQNNSEEQNTTSNTNKTENWIIQNNIFMANTTSTDTHKLTDGSYRMYYMKNGEIVYANSTDSINFKDAISTGIREEKNKMISNPAVLEITSNNWIMIYEMAPIKGPGAQQKELPGVTNQRNLYLATSSDGLKFNPEGIAIDSSKDDQFFASVPDLIKTSEGKIRLYYVCRGESICSQISSDNGKNWIKELGVRLTNQAVDPDVLEKDGKWIMYYTILDPARNAIYKATSNDGLKWENETKLISATTNGTVVDADVFEVTQNKYGMFLGQSVSGNSTGGEEINLYRGELNQSIF